MTGNRTARHPYLSIAVVTTHYLGWVFGLLLANSLNQALGLILFAYLVLVTPLLMCFQARRLKTYCQVALAYRVAYFASNLYLLFLGSLIVWALIELAVMMQ